jgi:hypothetical protein
MPSWESSPLYEIISAARHTDPGMPLFVGSAYKRGRADIIPAKAVAMVVMGGVS